ncbi:hypothetical protein NL676_009711 [Syzygium grande]|nr:hypothetical protein NL676_009711 [Syzygium grande]
MGPGNRPEVKQGPRERLPPASRFGQDNPAPTSKRPCLDIGGPSRRPSIKDCPRDVGEGLSSPVATRHPSPGASPAALHCRDLSPASIRVALPPRCLADRARLFIRRAGGPSR